MIENRKRWCKNQRFSFVESRILFEFKKSAEQITRRIVFLVEKMFIVGNARSQQIVLMLELDDLHFGRLVFFFLFHFVYLHFLTKKIIKRILMLPIKILLMTKKQLKKEYELL